MTDEKALVEVEQQPEEKKTSLIKPLVSPDDLIEHHKEVTELIKKALKKGQDYGVIPGTGTKPTLLKPGAERIAIAYGAAPVYSIVETEVDHDHQVHWQKRQKVWRNEYQGDKRFDWKIVEGDSIGLYRYVVRCDLKRRDIDRIIGSGMGSCSTMEGKYVDRPRDMENTTLKMAQKRALIASVLNTFGLSDRFTQDVEDYDQGSPENTRSPQAQPQKQPPKQNGIASVYAKASQAGMSDDKWKEMLELCELKKDKRTWTKDRLASLATKIDKWIELQQSDGDEHEGSIWTIPLYEKLRDANVPNIDELWGLLVRQVGFKSAKDEINATPEQREKLVAMVEEEIRANQARDVLSDEHGDAWEGNDEPPPITDDDVAF